MNVLGIETSCDETAAAVVANGRIIRSSVVASSLEWHRRYGGIIPEIAFRKQIETIVTVSDRALRDAKLSLKDIGLIAVTKGPGLQGALLVGMSFAKAVSAARNIPLIGVDHLLSHIYASFLEKSENLLPCVALVVSGGHTSLFYVRDFNNVTTLGQTRDDACGEAFDKVAKILGLGYPGGPLIERLAKCAKHDRIPFRCSRTDAAFDFSFSGVKTGVLYYAQSNGLKAAADIAASFQETAISALVAKSLLACGKFGARRLVAGGGVVANTRLRERLQDAAEEQGIKVYFPRKDLCMDNAAMVAGLGYRLRT